MVRIRGLGIAAAAMGLAVFLLLLVHAASAGAAGEPAYAYVGVASCAGSTCHGRSEPTRAVGRQDELMIWQNASSPTGAHSRAWAVLREPRARSMAARLGIGEASSAPLCLGCHATPPFLGCPPPPPPAALAAPRRDRLRKLPRRRLRLARQPLRRRRHPCRQR